MTSVRLRAMARSIRAEAEERAAQLDAIADEIERGDDGFVSLDDIAAQLGTDRRRVRRDLQRRGIKIETIGTLPFVARSALLPNALPSPRAKSANDASNAKPLAKSEPIGASAALARAAAKARR